MVNELKRVLFDFSKNGSFQAVKSQETFGNKRVNIETIENG